LFLYFFLLFNNNMKISIIGLGFVGSAMLKSFQEKDVNIIGVL